MRRLTEKATDLHLIERYGADIRLPDLREGNCTMQAPRDARCLHGSLRRSSDGRGAVML